MFYVMSDIHGCFKEFATALSQWDKEIETLIIMGDLIDRGPDSLKVVHALRKLKETYPNRIIVLKGNHDESFANWLVDTPEEDLGYYYPPGHNETIQSFYGRDPEGITKFKRDSRIQRGEHIRYLHKKELHFLARLPMVYETEHCIFVHAGINLKIDDWRDDKRCMNEIRNPFIYSKKKSPKRVFFGHTPTALIRHNQKDYSIWINEDRDKIGIDGGCAFGGQLNALKVNNDADIVQTIVVPAHKE